MRKTYIGISVELDQMKQKATFALGCFWEPEYYFSELKGVISTRVGYTGGKVKNPSYQQVCGGGTGHAEAVDVTFDDSQIKYTELLGLFWKLHDPTERTKIQYSSMVFYHNLKQKKLAEESKQNWEKKTGFKALTKIVKATAFYEAEEYHQMYLQKRKSR